MIAPSVDSVTCFCGFMLEDSSWARWKQAEEAHTSRRVGAWAVGRDPGYVPKASVHLVGVRRYEVFRTSGRLTETFRLGDEPLGVQ